MTYNWAAAGLSWLANAGILDMIDEEMEKLRLAKPIEEWKKLNYEPGIRRSLMSAPDKDPRELLSIIAEQTDLDLKLNKLAQQAIEIRIVRLEAYIREWCKQTKCPIDKAELVEQHSSDGLKISWYLRRKDRGIISPIS